VQSGKTLVIDDRLT